jgi:hypothetical protein
LEQLITIYAFSYPHEAAIIQGRLESEGIETFLKDELTVQTYHFYSNAVGGIKLQVWENDVEQAIAILKDAGYNTNVQDALPQYWIKLEGWKNKLPLIRNASTFFFIMFTITVLCLAIIGMVYFWMKPTTKELLMQNAWCMDYIVYQEVEYQALTVQDFILRIEQNCNEPIYFFDKGRVSLPGFSSPTIDGKWEAEHGYLKIYSLSAFQNIFQGTFKVEIEDRKLILTSDSAIIYADPIPNMFNSLVGW